MRQKIVLLLLCVLPLCDSPAQMSTASRYPRVRYQSMVSPTVTSDCFTVKSLDTPFIDSVLLIAWDQRTVLARKQVPFRAGGFVQLDVRHLPAASYYLCVLYRNGDTAHFDVRVKTAD